MKLNSIIIAFIIFAVLCAVPLLGSIEVTKISKRPQIVYEEEAVKVLELRDLSEPVNIHLLYTHF